MAAISDKVLEHEHVHCLFPTDLLFSLPCNRWNVQEGTGSSVPNWDLFQLLSLQSMTSFVTTTRERWCHTKNFLFGVGEEGWEGGILLKAQFLLQVSYKKKWKNIVKNIVEFFFVKVKRRFSHDWLIISVGAWTAYVRDKYQERRYLSGLFHDIIRDRSL